MIGEIKVMDGRSYEVISETLITGYANETPAQELARVRAGKPAPTYHYTAVGTQLLSKSKSRSH